MSRLFLSSPHMSDEGYEMHYIKDAFEKNYIAPAGENIDCFEAEVAEKVGAAHAVALSSGTAAIHLALRALGVGEGDIVFVQSLTFAGSANPVTYLNATPVFIDSEKDSWNMDPQALEEAFSKYEPKAVIVVHLYGLAANMAAIKEICAKHQVPIVEDAAESMGSSYQGQDTGTLTEVGIYSFNGNKIITTSGGGILVTNHADIADKAKFWSTQAKEKAPYYQHEEIGYNYRLSNISAGIGRGQLKVLDQRVQQKRHIFESYQQGLQDIEEIHFIEEREGERANYWLSACLIESDRVSPTDIIEALEKENIEARRIWKPMHLQPVFQGASFIGASNAEDFFDRGVCLPSDTKMDDTDIERVINIVKGLFK